MTILDDISDPRLTGRNRLDMHAPWNRCDDEGGGTGRIAVLPLDGQWQFHLAARPEQIPRGCEQPFFDASAWSAMPVPGNWELHGHGEALYCNIAYPFPPNPPHPPVANPTGCYRRRFTLPPAWLGQRIFLHFGAVDAAFHGFVNGHELGFGTDSKLPSEFEITSLLTAGENWLAVWCYRWPCSAYLEKQDYWHLSGIQRSVLLFAKPQVHLRDWSVTSRIDSASGAALIAVRAWMSVDDQAAALNGSGAIDYPGVSGYRISAQLCTAQGEAVAGEAVSGAVGRRTPMYGLDAAGEPEELGSATMSLTIREPRLWSAETPHLCGVRLRLLDPAGRVVDQQFQRLGIRTVRIQDGILTLNGVRLVIRGVNRHEFHPDSGRVLSAEQMRSEIISMKQLNFNAVRTSHYPNDPQWYELCDELGMYVVDEANLETHGLEAQLSRDPAWATAYLERAVRMVLRDRNHPCIIAWSLGNESFYGPHHAAMAAWIRFQDPTRVVQYESGYPPATISDVLAPMYPNLAWARQELSRAGESRPMIMCEYAYAKGNSSGNVGEFWDLVWEQPRFQGGFVWDWRDKALARATGSGGTRYVYGTARDEPRHVERMCINGVVGTDLAPHPGAWELKQVQSPVTVLIEDAARGVVRIHNRHQFLDTGHLLLSWSMAEVGAVLACATMPAPLLTPGAATTLTLAVPPQLPGALARELTLDVRISLAQAQSWAPQGHTISASQGIWIIPAAPSHAASRPPATSAALSWSRHGAELTVQAGDQALRFDEARGAIIGISRAGRELLTGPFEACFNRAPTDIDHATGTGGYAHQWQQAGLERLESRTVSMRLTETTGACVAWEVVSQLTAPGSATRIERTSTYACDASGWCTIDEAVTIAAAVATLPRIGLRTALAGWCDELSWYGGGPHEMYPDRVQATRLDCFHARVRETLCPYLFPQEYGLHGAVRWAAFRGAGRGGLMARGAPTLQFSALPYRLEDLGAGAHRDDLVQSQDIHLHIDGFHCGLGGDTGWMQNVHAPYLLPPGAYRWRCALRTLSEAQDPRDLGAQASCGPHAVA